MIVDPSHYFISAGIKLGCNVKNDSNKIRTNYRHRQAFLY